MNEKIFSHFIAEKNLKYLSHNNIVQQIQYIWHKNTFQRVLNQIPGDGGLYDKQPPQCKMEIPGEWGMSITRLLCLQNFKTLFSLYGLPLVSVMCRENIHNPPRRGTEIPEGLGGCQNEAISEGVGGLLTEVFFQGVWVRLVS